ncbi:MAG: class I SAM-dependent methyltransferase [Synechococcaceae cyanobacterium ELA445]
MAALAKRKLKKILVSLKLLGLADYLLFIKDKLLCLRANSLYIARTGALRRPADICWDAHNTTNLELIDRLGELHFAPFLSILDSAFPQSQKCLKIFEWGAGPGRLLLQFDRLRQQRPNAFELFGSDYNAKTVRFMSKYVSSIDYRANRLMPPLGCFEDQPDGFDFIYSFSVFTHLTEAAYCAWLKELLDLLTPGGIFCFTVNGDALSAYLHGNARQMYDLGEYVYFPGSSEGKKNSISHVSRAYVENSLPECCEIFEFIPGGCNEAFFQDLFAIRKCISAPLGE